MQKNNLNFTISERKLYLRFFDIVFPLLGLFSISYLTDFQYFSFENQNVYTWIISLVIYIWFFGQIFEMYNLKVASDKYLTFRSTLITVALTTVFYVFTPIVSPTLPSNRIQILYFVLALLVPILLHRYLYLKLIFSPRFVKNILIIAEVDQIENLLALSLNKGANNFVGYISNDKLFKRDDFKYNSLEDANLERIVKDENVDEIIVSANNFIPSNHLLNIQLVELFETGLSIKNVDNFIEEETLRISENQLTPNFYNNFTFSKSHQNNLYLTFRRFSDIVFSIVGIVIFIGLMPLVFIGNLIANRGSLFYTQKRVGKKGIEFKIIKFRSMKPNSEKNGAVWAKLNDKRITVFGRILRKTRIDEFPQFLNILSGDMSLIGPRPERPEFVAQLEKELPFYAIRHVIKPGLTGWAQVKHPYASSVKDQQEKLMYDLYYIKERNLLMDFKIVIKTISTVLFFRGT